MVENAGKNTFCNYVIKAEETFFVKILAVR